MNSRIFVATLFVATIPIQAVAASSFMGTGAEPACATLTGKSPQPSNSHAVGPDEYPLLSVMQNEQGNVKLDVRIEPNGTVSDARILQSSGFARLDGAAVDIVTQRFRYNPVISNGRAVGCRYEVMVTWHMDYDPKELPAYGPFAVERMTVADFPPESLARREEGISVVMVFVDTDGRVLQSKIFRSSGFADLDETALNSARNGKWKISPTLIDGKPVKSLAGFVVVWSP